MVSTRWQEDHGLLRLQERGSRHPRPHRTVNPATGEIVREFDRVGDDQAEELLAVAAEAFAAWRATPLAERAELFHGIANLIDSNTGELARLTTLEMGKPLALSVAEAGLAARMSAITPTTAQVF
jgi:succinate-semialdehyde dehydrogenase/glutarate-semialdehyde dehydrogenase